MVGDGEDDGEVFDAGADGSRDDSSRAIMGKMVHCFLTAQTNVISAVELSSLMIDDLPNNCP